MNALVIGLCLAPLSLYAQTAWLLREAPPDFYMSRPAGKPGTYLIPTQTVTEDGVKQTFLRSTDGVSWVPVQLPYTGYSSAGSSPSFNCYNGIFAGLAGESIWTLTDGLTSRVAYTPAAGHAFPWEAMAYGNSVWVVTESNGRVMRSEDNAATWKEFTTPAGRLGAIAFGAGKFVADANGTALTSTDGKTWTIGEPFESAGLCFEAGRFLTTTQQSTNGTTWTNLDAAQLPKGPYLRTGGGVFLSWLESESKPTFYTSTTSAWSGPFVAGVLDKLEDVAFCGDLWIGYTSSQKLITSATPATPPPAAPPLLIDPAARLSWQSQSGRNYIIQKSTNQTTWTDHTGSLLGTGSLMEWFVPASTTREFFRVQVR